MKRLLPFLLAVCTACPSLFLLGCGGEKASETITIYCGRKEALIGPLLKDYTTETGLEVKIKYGNSAELATLLITEGDKSPADVFISQDIGAMAAVKQAELLGTLPENSRKNIPPTFQDPGGYFTGLSGRLRTVVYNTKSVKPEDLPNSIHGFTDPKWKGRIGWAPANGSFQLFVTALRKTEGEEKAKAWLEGILANKPVAYPKNTPIVAAAGTGEIDVGFVNHYYLYRLKKEHGPDFAAANHFLTEGPGGFMNLACAGALRHTSKGKEATILIDFLQSVKAQKYFAEQTYEFPLVSEVEAYGDLPEAGSLKLPSVSFDELGDLDGTLKLLQDTGIL